LNDTPATPPTSRDVAVLLAEIGTLLELSGEDTFRARAFANAARALEGSNADLLTLARENRLTTLRGVGAGIAAVLREYVLTGRSAYFEELRAATPLALYDLRRIPGLGAKRIHTLHKELGIEDLDGLEDAALEGRIAGLPGFGGKMEAKILEGMDFARSNRQLRRYPEALEVGERILNWLREAPGVEQAELAGGLRRRMEVVEGIEILAATGEGEKILGPFRDRRRPLVHVGSDLRAGAIVATTRDNAGWPGCGAFD
jgi:DNA polymerase (family 10)